MQWVDGDCIPKEVVGDSLENIQFLEAVDNPKNVDDNQFDRVNLEGDQQACSVAHRTISLHIETIKRHTAYLGKLTPQKKSYKHCAVGGSSTNSKEIASLARNNESFCQKLT